ncbi:MAG: hypothetical protein KIS84_13735, partial [Dokdonella sp.]|nr:hypothetical protein [Dokdonella sp.]
MHKEPIIGMQDASTLARPTSSLAARLLAWGVAAVAAAWILATLLVIVEFGLRYPAFDQFRLYPLYLGLAFPDSAIQLENGHRPVLPALVRLLEVQWFGANQQLQLGVGIALVLATVALIGLAGRRDGRTALRGSTAWLLAVLAVLWLGNARMLIHGNELVHAYLVTSFTVLSLWAVHAATLGRPLRWMLVAGLCASGAAFSFGSGMAAFVALFFTAAAGRVAWRAWLAPLALFLAAIGLYLAGMPGDSGVRNSLLLSPLDNVVVGLRWLSAPWMHAWLGYANPAMFPFVPTPAEPANLVEAALRGSAGFVHSMLGTHAFRIEGIVIGAAAVAAWLACLWHVRRHEVWRGRLVAFGLATFGLAVGATICLARLAHFKTSPGDVLAERYLPWSCLFWLGLALYALAAPRRPSPRRDVIAAMFAVALAVMLYPSHLWWVGWAAAVNRINNASAVAAQMGIWDPERFPDGPDARKADVLRSLELMRERRLSMFGEPGYALWSSQWREPALLLPPQSGL